VFFLLLLPKVFSFLVFLCVCARIRFIKEKKIDFFFWLTLLKTIHFTYSSFVSACLVKEK
jgi:hypothetical protein